MPTIWVVPWFRTLALWVGACLAGSAGGVFGQADQPVYVDSLTNGWQNWSWAIVNFNNASPVHAGADSISVICTNNQALYLHHTAFDASSYTNLTFWVNGGSGGGQPLQVQATTNQMASPIAFTIPALSPNTWQLITVSLGSLGVAQAANMDGFWIQSRTPSQLAPFYVDDIMLVAATATPITNTPALIRVDAQLNRHPISPFIYGVAFAGNAAQLADLKAPLHRSGGNAETRYNWQLNAHNRGADWYFESIADSPATPGAADDGFVSTSKSGGAEPMLTIPMIGWAPKLGASRGSLASFSVAKYGAQTLVDPSWSDAGNGILAASGASITNDPADANFATNSAFQQALVQHLTNRWGFSTNGGVRFFLMDNEHSLWHSTHRDVHPVGATMQEIRDRIVDYGGMIKAMDPTALVLGPEEWGWSGYFYSGYDQQYGSQHGWGYLPDRAANGGMDYMPWLLGQLNQSSTTTKRRLLDYFTLHCYPQGGEFSSDVSVSMQLLRNRSTRQLWDTNYIDASWINTQVMLIPRMKSWVANYYPGTKIGLTEYNWGAEAHINGAIAQADLYGIFGREGLDLATRWTTPDPSTPTYKAMKMYCNYDGKGSGFGDTSISASGPNPDDVATFAALRSSDGALTLMVINKQLTASATANVTITNRLLSGPAQLWQLTSANVITQLADVNFASGTFTSTVAPQSITLFVLPAGPAPPAPVLRPGTLSQTNSFELWLDGTPGQRYVLESAPDLRTWMPVATNTLSSNTWHVFLTANGGQKNFYRGVWAP